MSTYLELQQRVANDHLNRSDFGSEVKRSILAAIRYYERRRWRFNQTATAIACSSGQAFISIPSNFLILDSLRITQTQSFPLITSTLDEILEMRASSATGLPTHYCLHSNRIELAVIPDSAYSVSTYYVKSLTELSADADTNAWTQGGTQDLIVYHATKLMFANVLRNEKQAAKFSKMEVMALNTVASEVEQFFNITGLRSTGF